MPNNGHGGNLDYNTAITRRSILDMILNDLAARKNRRMLSNKYHISINDLSKIQRLHFREIQERATQMEMSSMKSDLQKDNASNPAVLNTNNRKQTSNIQFNTGSLIDPSTGLSYSELAEQFKTQQAEDIEAKINELKKQEQLIPQDAPQFVEVPVNGHKRKVTNEVAAQILNDLKEEVLTQSELAQMYGVSPSLISKIKNGRGRFKLVDVQPEPEPELSENDETPKKLTKKQKKAEKLKEKVSSNVIRVDDGELLAIPIIEDSLTPKEDQAQAEKIIMNSSFINQRIAVTQYVTCGMIANRHNLPTDTYIFQDIDNKLLNDYQAQLWIAKSRIAELLSENPNSISKGVYMYVTGLTSVLASIIQACLDLKVNLTLLHYKPNEDAYYPQDIFTNFGEGNPCPPELNEYRCRQLYTYGCSAVDFVKNRNGYMVTEYFIDPDKKKNKPKERYHDNGSMGTIGSYLGFSEMPPNIGATIMPAISSESEKDTTLFIDKDLAWKYFIALSEQTEINNIYLINAYIGPRNKLFIGKTLSKVINTKWD